MLASMLITKIVDVTIIKSNISLNLFIITITTTHILARLLLSVSFIITKQYQYS